MAASLVVVAGGDWFPGETLIMHCSSRVHSSPALSVTVIGKHEKLTDGGSVDVNVFVVVTVLGTVTVVVVMVGGQSALAPNGEFVVLLEVAGEYLRTQSSPSSSVSPRSFVIVICGQLSSSSSPSSLETVAVTVDDRVYVRVVVAVIVLTDGQDVVDDRLVVVRVVADI